MGGKSELKRFARAANVRLWSPTILDSDIWDVVDHKVVVRPGRPGSGPSAIFRADMLVGESQEIFAERMENVGQGISKKRYIFQVRNDDGRDHFRAISRRYPSLDFVLAYYDVNVGEYGSYLIRDGSSRAYTVPSEIIESVMAKHEYDPDSEDADEFGFWEASYELADMAEARWLKLSYRRFGVNSRDR
jgi:hypothetical protein